ncbi:MAG: N-acetylmuramoyl-L-alanine amidase family protein [Dethiobacteria bacterium]
MPAEVIHIHDGLIENIVIKEKNKKVKITIFFSYPTIVDRSSVANPPYRLIINFNRYFLEQLFWNKSIIIDPGHGGKDCGLRGPVGLLEKDAVLSIAYQLRKIFELTGAKVWLTRQGDENVSAETKRANLQQQKAQFYVGLHLREGTGSQDGGFALAVPPKEKQMEKLAQEIGLEMSKKLNIKNNDIKTDSDLLALGIPAVVVEAATITNAVEEGLLRNSHFQWRTAQAIFNATIKYFYTKT